MAEIVDRERKSSVLRHPTLPCLSRHYTINLTAGCPFECRYCYARSFRSHPGAGKVEFYANTVERLKRELPRKRTRPELVYLSTACEPLMPHPRVLDALYEVTGLLLDNRIFVLISTKSEMPSRFLELLAGHPGMVHVQVGLTTADDRVRRLLEPHAADVGRRLKTVRALADRDVSSEVRIDPLTPGLTDTERSLTDLCREVASCGAGRVVASFLFLRRRAFAGLRLQYGDWSFADMARRVYTSRIGKYCGGGAVRLPAAAYREEKYAMLKAIAGEHGISVALCGCKNPDLTAECCHPRPPAAPGTARQGRLF